MIDFKDFIDFKGGNDNFEDLARLQKEGAIALFNILKKDKDSIAYLADEVGMGKTFIALGTVMLMRYLNPSLRVLYVAPNKQLKDQWISEYNRFIKNYVKTSHGNIKGFDNASAVPYVNCNSLKEMIEETKKGYSADYFVQMNSFSFPLSGDEDNNYASALDEIKDLIPAYKDVFLNSLNEKKDVKNNYALALNYILPSFDLIVVDEAHKFKNGIESSTRNRLMSIILGTYDITKGRVVLNNEQHKYYAKLTSKILLLSATPFDRDLRHLKNQIELFAGKEISNKYFDPNKNLDDTIKDNDVLTNILRQFLVRRLNKVKIGDTEATRNMYRVEHRDSAIELKDPKEKLIMALIQKHVGDVVEDKQTSSPSFQMGLLASFESFADSSGKIVFDGEEEECNGKDQARDANLIKTLNDSYKKAELCNSSLPHPKMNSVVTEHNGEYFANGEKHIFFVRRVKSVSELTNKWNERYNNWLIEYLKKSRVNPSISWEQLFKEYVNFSSKKNKTVINQNDDEQPTEDTFFSWFFRGRNVGISSDKQDVILFKDFKVNMTKSNSKFSLFFELNIAKYFIDKLNININTIIDSDLFLIHYSNFATTNTFKYAEKQINYFNRYHAAQYACLKYIENKSKKVEVNKILEILYGEIKDIKFNADNINLEDIKEDLNKKSIFNELNIINDSNMIETFILKELLLTQFKLDHLVIDLYISLLKANFSKKSKDDDFINEFMTIYNKQESEEGNQLSSYSIINNVKYNIKMITEITLHEFSDYVNKISQKGIIYSYERNKNSLNLNPLDPIIGVSGDTADKTIPAMKFRLPGYPIVMISTDVMQEGVNLHTFCRSITHYGLSGTPIHIEQKNGRVDRINSLTHRKIQNTDEGTTLSDFEKDKIQVRFPFVKQSYESYQVRKLSNNLNQYMKSLNDFKTQDTSIEVLIEKEINDASPIPKAYEKLLKTPYEIDDVQKKVPVELFEKMKLKFDEKLKLVNLLSMHFNNLFGNNEDIKNKLLSGKKIIIEYEPEFYIQLRSAKSNGEFLLEFSQEKEDSGDAIELLVGSDTYINNDEQLTHEEEILGAVERLFTDIDLNKKKKIDNPIIENIKEYWENNNNIPFARSDHSTFEFENCSIIFHIGESRKHTVDLYSINICDREYVLFHTKVCKISNINYEVKKVVDIVKFQDEDGYIIGYTLHDLNNLQPKEFMYNAYILAIEADIFEYQLSIEDKF